MRRKRVESSKFCPPVAPVETTRIVNGPLSTADRVEFEDRIVKHFGFRAVSSKARSAYGSAVDIFSVQTAWRTGFRKEKEESCGFRSQLFWQGRTNGGGPALPSINQLRTFTNDFRSRSFRLFAESIAD